MAVMKIYIGGKAQFFTEEIGANLFQAAAIQIANDGYYHEFDKEIVVYPPHTIDKIVLSK